MYDVFSAYKELLTPVAPSGHASKRADHIIKLAEGLYDDAYFDRAGNLFLHKKGDGAPILLSAAMGTRALQVSQIDEKGFLRFIKEPAHPLYSLAGKRVRFESGSTGVLAYDSESALWHAPSLHEIKPDKFYVDLGVCDHQEAETFVSAGEYGVLASELRRFANDTISGTYLCDLVGCVTLLSLLETLKFSHSDVFFVFTEDKPFPVSISRISPKLVIRIAGSSAAIPFSAVGIHLGMGPAIQPGAVSDPILDLLVKAANVTGNSLQYDFSQNILPVDLPFDAAQATISLPVRYCGSPSEMVCGRDIDACSALVFRTFCA